MISTNHASMQGKVCLVTGATRGLGQAVALGLSQLGATVVIISRNQQRVDQTLAYLHKQSGNLNHDGYQADLSSISEVRRVSQQIIACHPTIDVLVNNVGATIMKYRQSADGYEMSWALNYLNHFLLTHLLADSLQCAAQANGEARVVEVTSSMYRFAKPHFSKLISEDKYNGVLAYAQSKRAMMMFTYELARRWQPLNISVNAVTPGLVKSSIASHEGGWSSQVMRLLNLFALPVEQGVQPILHLAAAPEMKGITGQYYKKFKQMPVDSTCLNPENVRQLWQLSERMTGLAQSSDA